MSIQITITNAGRAEIINAANTGTAPVTITHVGVGTGQYVPAATQNALQAETKRLATIAGQVVADDTIHVTIKDESNDVYNVSEFGLFTESGTLFAVYSQTSGPFMQKAGPSTLLLSVDILLGTLDANNITFGDTSFSNPPASETTPGVVQISTLAEALAGTAVPKAVPPHVLKAVIDQLTAEFSAKLNGGDMKASVRVATTASIANLAGGAPNALDGIALALNDRILVKDQTTPAQNGIYVVTTLGTGANGTWSRATDADGVGELTSGAIVAVEEGATHADTLWMLTTDGPITIGTTPLTFARKDSPTLPVGSVIHVAMAAAPIGFLKANGAAVSRTAYANLFAAIGTNFGAGDGATTFNLPDLRGEFVRSWDDGRGVDSGRAFGSAQSDDVKSHTHKYGNTHNTNYGLSSTGIIGVNPGASINYDTGATGGTETRPRNIALLACIKY